MIDPRYLDVHQWTDAVNLAVATSAPVVKLPRAEDWRAWASITLAIPSVAVFSPPDPQYFSDWRSWAERFSECVLL